MDAPAPITLYESLPATTNRKLERCALTIPHRPSAEIVTGFHLEVRRQLAGLDSIEAVEEGRRRLAAWQAYVTKREQRQEIAAASRWCEIRIGELLGKAEPKAGPGRGKKALVETNGFECPRIDRHNFRLLAKHKNLVSKLINGGQVSRKHLLDAIKEVATNGKASVDEGHRVVDGLADLPEGSFGCIYADPPWQYGNQATRAATGRHYETLSVDALCEWPVAAIAAPDAHLHLWTTNAFLPGAFKVIEAWGFEYRSVFVWVKPQMGIGNYWRVSHEFLLLGIRGNAKRFKSRSLKSWGEFPRGRHSSKPEEVRGYIESASEGPYLELFGRRSVDGWTVLGNQVTPTLFPA